MASREMEQKNQSFILPPLPFFLPLIPFLYEDAYKNPTASKPPLYKGRFGGVKIICSFTANWYNN
jgi:hypothetical protein